MVFSIQLHQVEEGGVVQLDLGLIQEQVQGRALVEVDPVVLVVVMMTVIGEPVPAGTVVVVVHG